MRPLWALALLGCPGPVSPTDVVPTDTAASCPAWPAVLAVPVAEDGEPWRRLGWRSVEARGDASLSGPFDLLEADGRWWIRALEPGTGALEISGGCVDTVTLVGRRETPRIGRTHPELGLTPVRTFAEGQPVRFAVDPRLEPALAGSELDVWLVESRDRETWTLDAVLEDVRGAPQAVRVEAGGRAENAIDLWTATGGPRALDLVLDLDRDGRLSAGDRLEGLDVPGLVVLPDLAAPGPYAWSTGDHAPTPETTRRVWWPDEAPGPMPLVVISHGLGQAHTDYDGFGAHLASWGAVVVAHRNDPAAGVEAAATATLLNLEAFLADQPLLLPELDGLVDTDRILLLGHSRGGEGANRLVARLEEGSLATDLTAEQVALVVALAPTVLLDPLVEHRHDRPRYLILGSADTDVTGGVFDPVSLGDCGACQSFRLLQGTGATVGAAYLHGASHSDFDCCGEDPGAGRPLVGREATQHAVRSLLTGLLVGVVGGEPGFAEVLWRPDLELGTGGVVQRLWRPAEAGWIDDFLASPEPGRSSAGTPVSWTVGNLVEGPLDDGDLTFAWNGSDPMNGMTFAHDESMPDAARGVVFDWTGDAHWTVGMPDSLPEGATHLQVDLTQGTRHPHSVGPLELDLVLEDGSGHRASLRTRPYGAIPLPYDREGGWASAFDSLVIPIADFVAREPDLDPSDLRTFALEVGPGHGSARGRLGVGRTGVIAVP